MYQVRVYKILPQAYNLFKYLHLTFVLASVTKSLNVSYHQSCSVTQSSQKLSFCELCVTPIPICALAPKHLYLGQREVIGAGQLHPDIAPIHIRRYVQFGRRLPRKPIAPHGSVIDQAAEATSRHITA